MKKLLLVAAACVALASCVKNEVIPEPADKRPISYQTLVKPETTRAAEVYNGADFKASALKVAEGATWPTTTGVYFDGVTVKDDVEGYVGQWTTTPACYWPMTGGLVFYAHSPATVVAETLADPWTYTFTNYSMDNDVDFMVAEIEKGADSKGLKENNVPVKFGHKLTKVVVKIGVAEIIGGATYTLKSIVFNNLGDAATFTKTAAGVEAWSVPVNFHKNYTIFNGTLNVTADLKAVPTSAQTVGIEKEFYIPHTLVNNAHMVVTYNVAEPGLGNKDHVKTVMFSDIHHPDTAEWVKNNQVTYTLIIGAKERIIWDTPTIPTGWTEVGYSVAI